MKKNNVLLLLLCVFKISFALEQTLRISHADFDLSKQINTDQLVPEQLIKIPYVDFDVSMKKEEHLDLLTNPKSLLLYDLFKTIWQFVSNPNLILPTQELRIPKKLHFIWLGDRERGLQYRAYIQSWIDFHPDWEFKLWTEDDIPTFNFKNKDLFDESSNYSRKADIWCLEILEQFGGLYLNIDYECLKRMDIFNYTYDFYIAMQPLDTNMVQLGTGLIGSIAHHPILTHAIERLRDTRHVSQIIVATGPIFFTQCYIECVGKTGLRDVVFPASYLYPCGYTQRGQQRSVWDKPEAYAVHHWAGSWLGKEGFVPGTV